MGPKRRNDFWASNNRVLNGGKKKCIGRNPNFDTEETTLLISLWGDPKVQKTLITTHKKHPVIARLAEQLREYGYTRTTEEINTRIKNLKCFYNRIRKDMEVGIIAEPTWKHFRSMERIMTRPIFSVRPNEVPKPSPRFRMDEQDTANGSDENYWSAKEKRTRRQTSDDLEMMGGWNGTEEDDDDDELFTQEMLEAEMDCDIAELPAEMREAMEVGLDGEMTASVDDVKKIENTAAEIKKEPVDEHDEAMFKAESGLIVPKLEPIDVDDVDNEDKAKKTKDKSRDENDANEIFPKLSAYLQLASSNATSSSTTKANNKVITTVAGTSGTNTSEINTSTSNHLKISQPMVLTQQQSQQGKISLVPTNILLKPPQQQMQLRPQAGQHIIYNPNLGGNSGLATSTAGQMPNGMKVLLVNTLPKSCVGSSDAQTKIITSNAMKGNCITSTVPSIGEARSRAAEARSQKTNGAAAGFRTLMTQLIQVQSQNLEVSRQRLDVERQRLDFEKSIAERIIAALPNFANIFMPPTTAMPQTEERAPTPTMPLLTPKIEKED